MKILPRRGGATVLLVVFTLTGPSARAVTRYVNVNNVTPAWPYTNWSMAATVIQTAVGACAPGDTVLVTNGVYAGSAVTPPGYGHPATVVLTNSITVRSVNPLGAVIASYSGSRCAYVTNGAQLIGFDLSSGRTAYDPADTYDRSGAGIFLDHGGVVISCRVSACDADYRGGGVYFRGGGTLSDTEVSENSAVVQGGGVFCEEGGALSNCVIRFNECLYNGGGLFLYQGGSAEGCWIAANTAWTNGGGVYAYRGGILNRCRVATNLAGRSGGGVYLAVQGWTGVCTVANSLVLRNTALYGGGIYSVTGGVIRGCTITENVASNTGGGVFCDHGATNLNSIIYGNSAPAYYNWRDLGSGLSFKYCCTVPTSGLPGAVGCIEADPQFESAAAADYRLKAASSCVNAGSNSYAWGSLDLAGEQRIGDGTVDLGATETFLVRYVCPTGANTRPYNSWAQAARDIQAAVDVAATGTTVLVGDGVYSNGGAVHQGSNRVLIAKEITVQSVNGPAVTVIRGQGPAGDAAVRCVAVVHGGRLGGFLLTNGSTRATWSENEGCGGGAYLDGRGTLSNCWVHGNQAFAMGGGVFMAQTGTVTDCSIAGNTASSGGGLAGYGAYQSVISRVRIERNEAESSGGGIYYYVSPGPVSVSNCLLRDNRAALWGGGILYAETKPVCLVNCLMFSNSAALGGVCTAKAGSSRVAPSRGTRPRSPAAAFTEPAPTAIASCISTAHPAMPTTRAGPSAIPA